MNRIQLLIDSNLCDVSLVAVATNRICIQLGMGERPAGDVELCVAEAATNVIRHAYHSRPGQSVSVTLSSAMGILEIEVADRGTPMADEHVKRLVHGSKATELEALDLASLPEGGRGLQIIRAVMDETAYLRRGDENILQLKKRIARESLV